jgi:ketosteroid isomerase-like protein
MTPQEEIKATLATMFAAWNREDQARYLTHYWKHDDLRWSMKGAWYKGWSSMFSVYGQDYPRGAMGITAIFDVEVMMLADDIGIALYTWTHDTPRENVAGCTSQVFRKVDGAWLVIHENSARVPAS